MSTHHSTGIENGTHLDLRPLEQVDSGTNSSTSASSSNSGVENGETHIQREQLPIQTINHRNKFVREWESIRSNRLAISFPVEFATDRSPAKWLKRINEKSHKWPKCVLRCAQFTPGRIYIAEMPGSEQSVAVGYILQAITLHCAALPLTLQTLIRPDYPLHWLQRTNGSQPTPDLVVSPRGSITQAPSFVVEVGFFEGKDSLDNDADLYIANGVNVLLLHIPDNRKKVISVVHTPAQTTIKYEMWYRLLTLINGVHVDSGWTPFGNRAVGHQRRCTGPNQVTLNIPTAAIFEYAPAIVPGQPHWSQLPVHLAIDCWDLQQCIISEVKRDSGYV